MARSSHARDALAKRRQRRQADRGSATKRAQDRKANIMMAGVVAFAVAVGGAAYAFRAPSTDLVTNCRMDGELPSHTIVLIDATDALPPVAASDLRARVGRIQNGMEPYAKISVLTVEGGEARNPVQELFSSCNPGRGSDANPLFRNQAKVEAAWRKEFFQPLEMQIQRLGALGQADSTPLFEALYLMGARNDFDARVLQRRLVVVSDFLHHTQDYSHYKSPADFEAALEGSPYLSSMIPSLSGVDVEAVFVPRREVRSLQGEMHKAFWRDYFRRSGSPVDTFENG